MSPVKKPAPPADATAARERHADIADLPYEAARDELVAIVGRLEGGQGALEESMRLWERGEALADHCAAWLDGAQQRLTRDDQGQRQGSTGDADSRDGGPAIEGTDDTVEPEGIEPS